MTTPTQQGVLTEAQWMWIIGIVAAMWAIGSVGVWWPTVAGWLLEHHLLAAGEQSLVVLPGTTPAAGLDLRRLVMLACLGVSGLCLAAWALPRLTPRGGRR